MNHLYQDISYNEKDLLGRASMGDYAAFNHLADQHYQSLMHRIADTLCDGDEEQAADLMQQSLLDILQNPQTLNTQTSFSQIVINTAQAALEKEGLSPETSFTAIIEGESLDDVNHLVNAISDKQTPSNILDNRQAATALKALMVTTSIARSPHAKGISYLFAVCVDGHSLEEVADRENKSTTEVETAIERACLSHYPSLSVILAP